MTPIVLGAYTALSATGFLLLVAVAGYFGRRLSGDDFSWGRYVAWLVAALAGVVLLLASASTWVFVVVAVLVVAWVLLRAAGDAQATTVRERIGFLQLYLGLFLVEYAGMVRTDMITGARASASLRFVLHDVTGHAALPFPSLLSPAHGPAWAMPATWVAYFAGSIADHWLLAVALTTFAVAASAYAYFAEHATPNLGLGLLPFPTAASIVLVAAWAGAYRLEGTPAGVGALFAAVLLTPFFAAEGSWVAGRLTRRLRIQSGLRSGLAVAAVVLPSVAAALSGLGLVFHLVRLRAFQPILGDVRRSAERPRLSTAFVMALAASAMLCGLGAVDRAMLLRASPSIEAHAALCERVTLERTSGGVRVVAPSGTFVIDEEETLLPAAAAGANASAEAVCASRGRRVCTSDEWYVSCLCTYPNDSLGGVKWATNSHLVYRIERETGQVPEPAPPPASDVRGLLTGRSEVVTSEAGMLTLAGPNDIVDDPWTVDCRYRALSTPDLLDASHGAPEAVAVRCCR